MSMTLDSDQASTTGQIRQAVADLCATFDGRYWQQCDRDGSYPEEFVSAMTRAGWLGALIPEEYGGSGLSLVDACAILEEVNASGANGASCHAQMYTMAAILNHGSEEQKRRVLPRVADGSLRVQAFGVTEPDADRIGEEGKGFYHLLDSLNSERLLVASESLGDGRWFIDRASRYASERIVFDRPIGANQGVQFPIAKAYMNLRAATLMRDRAAALFDSRQPCGPESNMAKYLASEASWEAAEAAMITFGGNGVACEYDIERKWKEARLFRIAPISNNLVLAQVAQHVLGMPRSY